jgi:hypothetical protein
MLSERYISGNVNKKKFDINGLEKILQNVLQRKQVLKSKAREYLLLCKNSDKLHKRKSMKIIVF